MAVQDRMREHAVLQTIGFSPGRVFGLVMAECLLISAVGGVAGVGVAEGFLAWSRLAVGTEGVTITFAPSATLASVGIIVALGAGVLAGLAPAWKAARAEIVTALRQV
jgi:putative ABC transport system permease protein